MQFTNNTFNIDLSKVNLWAKNNQHKRYQNAAEEWLASSEGQKVLGAYKVSLNLCINTYPKPYRCTGFPGFPIKDQVIDQSGFPIRSSESYCANKIRQVTGEWPKAKGHFLAKDWKQFLAKAGYRKIANVPRKKHWYVGINPDKNLVVWFEHESEVEVKVSSYINEIHKAFFVDTSDYTWVEIQ